MSTYAISESTSTQTSTTTPITQQQEQGNAYGLSAISDSTINVTDGGAVAQALALSRETLLAQQEQNRQLSGLADSAYRGALTSSAKTTTDAISAVRGAAGDKDQRVASEKDQLINSAGKWLAIALGVGGVAYVLSRG